MPIQIDATTLYHILRVGTIIHTESECKITVKSDEIRLQSQSIDKTVYFESSLPRSDSRISWDNNPGSFWIKLDPVQQFARVSGTDEIQFTLPLETSDRTFILEAGKLTYQSPSLIVRHGHRLPDVVSSDTVSICTISHGEFRDAVTLANNISNELQVCLDRKNQHVEFTATERGDGDCFTYVVQPEQIDQIHDSATQLTIPIAILRDLIHKIPPTTPATIRLSPDHIQYTLAFPTPRSRLTLYVAKRQQIVPG